MLSIKLIANVARLLRPLPLSTNDPRRLLIPHFANLKVCFLFQIRLSINEGSRSMDIVGGRETTCVAYGPARRRLTEVEICIIIFAAVKQLKAQGAEINRGWWE